MNSLFANVSGLTGLLVFLTHVGGYTSLERLMLTAFGAGIAVYLVLILSYTGVQYIVALAPPTPADKDQERSSDNDASRSPSANQTTPSPQAA